MVHSTAYSFIGFEKCVVPCVYHYNIKQIVSHPKDPLCLPIHLSFPTPTKPETTTDPFTVSVVLPFSELHIESIHLYKLLRLDSFT